MTDDLRTRIAAVLTEARIVSHRKVMDDGYVSVFIRSDEEAAEYAADVLIRELNLTREYSIAENDGSRVLWLDGEDPITPRDGETVETRWITEWTTNE